jgi:hypothetical protein
LHLLSIHSLDSVLLLFQAFGAMMMPL